MKRELWRPLLSRKEFPSFICPKCKAGALTLDAGDLIVVEPNYSASVHGHEAWDPDWIEERFSAVLRCSVATCTEAVVISGDTVIDQVVDEEHGWVYEQMLRPRACFPPVHIIELGDDVPDEVRNEIEGSFMLFWGDLRASASRLRTSVERVLDHFKIPSTKTGGGFLPLNDRILEFKKVDSEHAETFDALRYVGNVGTHEGGLKREALLDAFEIYEDALEELFEKAKHKAKIDALKKKIIAAKGKYK